MLHKCYHERPPVSGLRNVRLLHNYVRFHIPELVKHFLKSDKVTVLPHQPNSPDLAPCNLFLFRKTKKNSHLVVITSSDKPVAQPSISVRDMAISAYLDAF